MLKKTPRGNPACPLNSKTPARVPRLSDDYGRWNRGRAFHPNSEVSFVSSSAPCELQLPAAPEYVMDSDVGAW